MKTWESQYLFLFMVYPALLRWIVINQWFLSIYLLLEPPFEVFLLFCSMLFIALLFWFIRVKFIIEEIEREEAALREDLYSADRKFAEYYNVCQ